MPSAPVLIITHGFPPYIPTLGGAIRMLKFAEHLRALETDVYVVAARGRDFGSFGYERLLESLHVHYVSDPLYRRGSQVPTCESTQTPGRPASTRARLTNRAASWFKPIVLGACVPDTGIAAVPGFYQRARALIEKHGIRNVVTSGPPHSDHLVGWLLKRRFGDEVNWLVDYRDSWNGTPLFRKSHFVLQALNMRAERAVLDRADHFVYVSPPMIAKAQEVASDPGRLASRSLLVMNGYDEMTLAHRKPWTPQAGPLHIGYFGALDDGHASYRNPTRLFEAIVSHDLQVRVELWGAVTISKHWIERLGQRIAVCGNLSHDAAFARMCEYDALLLLHTRDEGAEEVVTGKLFEYLASGRPVLSIGPAVMAANRILAKETCNVQCAHDDSAAIAAALRELARRKETHTLGGRQPADIARYSRSHQYSLLHGRLV